MIRINLKRNRVPDGTAFGSGTSVSSSDGSGETREALIKIALILLFTLALMVFENQKLSGLNSEQTSLQNQVTTLESQAQVKAQEVDAIKDIAQRAQELEDKLKVLNLLSHLRLRGVKTLDFMQSSIPEKVWVKNVSFAGEASQLDGGHFQFSGSSISTEDLTEFVRRLEGSKFLSDVIVIRNQETQSPVSKQATYRDFVFTAEAEVVR